MFSRIRELWQHSSLFILMGWRTLYIEESQYVSLYLDNLKVEVGSDDKLLIPLKDIDTIVLDNFKMKVSTGLFVRCIEYGINLLVCDKRHLPISQSLSLRGNYHGNLMLRKQISWKNERKEILWKIIVEKKIANQILILSKYSYNQKSIMMLENFMNNVELGDYNNREGLAAKVYFNSLYGKNFRRFSEDTINYALNYGYTIIRALISRSIVAKGLNPILGIFHKGPSNFYNLSDDIIEVFRPIVDGWVKENINKNDLLDKEKRIIILKIINKKIKIDGKKQTFKNAIDIMVDSIINFLENKQEEVLIPQIELYDI